MKGFTIGLTLLSWKLLIKLPVLFNKLCLGFGFCFVLFIFLLNQYRVLQ